MKIALSTHPETNTQLLIRSLRLYHHVFLRVFIYALLLSIIAFIPRVLTLIYNRPTLFDLTRLDVRNLGLILVEVCSLIFFTALLWRVRCVILDEHESMAADIKIALKKIPYIFAASVIQFFLILMINVISGLIILSILDNPQVVSHLDLTRQLLLMLLFYLQVFAVFYICFAFYFYLPIILIENNGILASLQKSASIVWRNWWRTFCVQLVPWLGFLLTLIVLKMVTTLNIRIYYLETIKTPDILSTFIVILIFAFFIPWMACLILLQMRDLELRKIEQTSAIIPG